MDARKIEIEGINKLVEEGIPADYMLLVQTDEGLETDLLVRQYIKEALTKGEICVAVLSESSPEDFKRLMSAIGINAESHEKNGTLYIVDWYSFRNERIIGVEEKGAIYKCSKSLTNVEIAISKILKKIEGKQFRVYSDILSNAIKVFGFETAFKFSQGLTARIKKYNGGALFKISKTMHEQKVISAFHSHFNGVLDIEHRREDDRVVARIGIISLDNLFYETSYKKLGVSKTKGIIIMDEEAKPKPVVKKVVKEEVPEEEPGEEDGEKIEEMKGSSVLIYEEDPRYIYRLYRQFLAEGMPGLCISTTFPAKLKKLHKFESEVLWISESSEKGAIKPGRMEFELMREVGNFLKNNKEGVLVLDCIETLILENGFDKVVKFLKKIGDMAAVNGNTVLAVINDKSMEQEKLYVLSKSFDMKITREELEKAAKKPKPVEAKPEVVPGAKEEVVSAKEEKVVAPAPEVKEEAGKVEKEPEVVKEEKALVGREAFTNGLKKSVTAREAYTNGLGKRKPGYVNGLKKPGVRAKPAKVSRVKQIVVGLVVVVIAISIFAFLLFTIPSEKIKVDGNIDDWQGLAVYKDTEDFANPDIKITEYSIYYSNEKCYFYVKVAGTAFNGANSGYDTLILFIDTDGNPNTGYRIENLGADAKIEVGGFNGNIHTSSVALFKERTETTRPELNYSAWESAGGVVVEKSGNIVEGSAKITGMTDPVALVVMRHYVGSGVEEKRGMAIVGKTEGSLVIYQNFIGSDVVNADADVLELRLIAKGRDVHVEGLSVANASVSLQKKDIAVNEEVVVHCRARGLEQGRAFEFALQGVDTNVPCRVVGNGGKAYFGTLPSGIVIDGAFGDWQGVEKGSDVSGDASQNIDLREYASAIAGKAYFYMAVDGTMLAGCEIPVLGARPPVQSGPPMPVVIKENLGLDVARVYIDLMNSTINTFNPAMISDGYLIELQGRNGQVISARAWKWENGVKGKEIQNPGIDYGLSDGKIEFSVAGTALAGLNNDTKFYFEMTNWLGEKDDSEFAYRAGKIQRENTAANSGTRGTLHLPIHINGNADFLVQALANGWPGDGTQGNPYIIDGYEIDGGQAPALGMYGIWIENTNVYFVIRNCTVYNATNSGSAPYGAGIALN
ncbi:MAG: DUF835 domain-containing protein, partial [Thermoplasmata archaeon]